RAAGRRARGRRPGRWLLSRRGSGTRDHRRLLPVPVHEREPHLIADRVVTPDLGDEDMVVLAKTPGDVDHPGGHVEMTRRARSRKVRPLRQRLEMIDRFAGLDLDYPLEAVA